jgi:hypothetical protein
MSVKYFDICDTAFKRDSSTCEISILRSTSDGKVYEDSPSPEERDRFWRNWDTSSVILEETAYKLALDPSISY